MDFKPTVSRHHIVDAMQLSAQVLTLALNWLNQPAGSSSHPAPQHSHGHPHLSTVMGSSLQVASVEADVT